MQLKFWKRIKKNVRNDNEKGAREALLEELFNDFNRNRFTVYQINFVRGIFFGLGSVLGGTLIVALAVWLLNTIGLLIPGLDGLVGTIVELVQKAGK